MDFLKKARIRMEHWITHNEHHQEEYEMLAKELKRANKKESASCLLNQDIAQQFFFVIQGAIERQCRDGKTDRGDRGYSHDL